MEDLNEDVENENMRKFRNANFITKIEISDQIEPFDSLLENYCLQTDDFSIVGQTFSWRRGKEKLKSNLPHL